MFSKDDCKIILSAWLREEHLEDLKLIPTGEFVAPYDSIVGAIKKDGVDLRRLYSKFGVIEILDLLRNDSEVFYAQAMQSALKNQMVKTMPQDAEPSELIEHAKKYQRYWYEKPKPADLAMKYMNALDKRANEKEIMTGIIKLDKLTYGIHKGQLTIVAARPSVGKSAFTLQVAFDVARKGNKVLFLPLEMSAEETVERIVLRFGDALTPSALRSKEMTKEQQVCLNEVLSSIDDISKDNFKVYENIRDLDMIASVIRDEKPDLIVIDQLSQIRCGDGSQSIRERYVEITRTLKALALEEDVAIWLPCQMNRESSKTDLVSIDYLKESGSIEEDADIVIILSNVKDANGDYVSDSDGRAVRMEIAKNRQGACGSEELKFKGVRFWFQNVIKGFEPYNGKEKFDD